MKSSAAALQEEIKQEDKGNKGSDDSSSDSEVCILILTAVGFLLVIL